MRTETARDHAENIPSTGLVVGLATSEDDVRESQQLRHAIFAGEMGARLETPEPGLDVDRFDAYCDHILVRDVATARVVASTRVLTDAGARRAGGFYSASEFDLGNFLRDAGPVLEIGRTCVHPDYRSGAAVSLLWSGLARFLDVRRFRHMIGCASLPMDDGGASARATWTMLKDRYLLPEESRVVPRLPVPALDAPVTAAAVLPPLLKAYIRLGARIGGEPCHDPDFGCADLFIVLSPSQLQKRYAKHFVERQHVMTGREAASAA